MLDRLYLHFFKYRNYSADVRQWIVNQFYEAYIIFIKKTFYIICIVMRTQLSVKCNYIFINKPTAATDKSITVSAQFYLTLRELQAI